MLGKLHSQLRLDTVNSGIAFTVPLSGARNLLLQMINMSTESISETVRKERYIMTDIKYSLVTAIVNRGFSGDVMKAAKAAGASGALRTAQGLNTFVENTMRGMKMVMTFIDRDGIARVARMTADWVLLYDEDQSIKGDVYVRSVGLIGRVLKVQRDAARLQLLNLCLNSQLLTQSIGVKGIIELFRPSLIDLDINPDDVLPSKAEIGEQDALMKIAQVVQAVGGGDAARQEDAAGGGMQSGVSPVEQPGAAPQGGVAERRGAA